MTNTVIAPITMNSVLGPEDGGLALLESPLVAVIAGGGVGLTDISSSPLSGGSSFSTIARPAVRYFGQSSLMSKSLPDYS